jgi:predicted RNase H-related nuclease YkuK (DUF458 family)
MNKIFKTVSGTPVDVVKHTLDIMSECPWVEIHVGTDSQNQRHKTIYSIVIAYRYGTRGVHYIVCTQACTKIRDRWTRLWGEVERSIEIAEWLSSKVSIRLEIDFDFNENEKHFSNKLVTAAAGWATSLGYKTNIKPHNQIATRAADHHCR